MSRYVTEEEATTLTEKQRKVLDFVRWQYRSRGVPPTIREIKESCHLSSNSVVEYTLKGLRGRRLVKDVGTDRGASRCYVPVMPDGSCAACGCGGEHGGD